MKAECLVLNTGNSFFNPLEFKIFFWGEGGVSLVPPRATSLMSFIKDPAYMKNPTNAPEQLYI